MVLPAATADRVALKGAEAWGRLPRIGDTRCRAGGDRRDVAPSKRRNTAHSLHKIESHPLSHEQRATAPRGAKERRPRRGEGAIGGKQLDVEARIDEVKGTLRDDEAGDNKLFSGDRQRDARRVGIDAGFRRDVAPCKVFGEGARNDLVDHDPREFAAPASGKRRRCNHWSSNERGYQARIGQPRFFARRARRTSGLTQ